MPHFQKKFPVISLKKVIDSNALLAKKYYFCKAKQKSTITLKKNT